MACRRFGLTLLLALGACLDAQPQSQDERCGLPPNAPGTAVAFKGDTATMTRVQWEAIAAWRTDVGAWFQCVEVQQ